MQTRFLWTIAVAALSAAPSFAQTSQTYRKIEYRIPMRDGRRLYTAVYVPRNVAGNHPILLERTPYGAGPYGPEAYRGARGAKALQEKGFIFAYQDVRGMGQSEGAFTNVRPQVLSARRSQDIDESTDTYDTIDYLVKNVPENNGKVGLWGISYPGFYAAVGAIDSHPALKAVSPQAPVADWFVGDDFHHHGALMLMDALRFGGFGQTNGKARGIAGFTPEGTDNAYDGLLTLGTLAQITEKFFSGTDGLWKYLMEHPDYDDYWQARSLPDKMKKVRCAVLTVGGWFDAEDCWGALHIYQSTEAQNRGIVNALVMGPWYHGQWAGGDGTKLGPADWGSNTSAYYQEKIELPFFEAFLLGDGGKIPEAQVFETGTNRWRTFPAWPPRDAKEKTLYLTGGKGLAFSPAAPTVDTYVSDPASPVPYQGGKITTRTITYLVDDQRFATDRPDVLTYTSEPLKDALTVAGPIQADIAFSTTGTDLDLVVKVIDVRPDGTARLLRGEVFRARYRDSYANPSPLKPGQRTALSYELPDVLHTFQPGHRIQVQVQSSWFPLVDRNPQQFISTTTAKPEDFAKANVSIFTGGADGTRLRWRVLEK